MAGFVLATRARARAGGPPRARHHALSRRGRRRRPRGRRPRAALRARGGKAAGATRCCSATTRRSRASSTSRGRRTTPPTGSARAERRPGGPRGRPRPRERARGDRRVRPWAVDASSSLETRRASRITTRCARSSRRRDERRYGEYGGRYVPETLIPALDELERGWTEALADPTFRAELDALGSATSAGRRRSTSRALRAASKRIWLKREDLLHTGAHKINNALGQALLARRLGKRRIVAETGAGQHGVATATVCARFGLECVVYMGAEDMRRQRPNVERMRLLGAEVRPVEFGTRTLKEATSEAIRDWITNVETTYYLIGSCVGPQPYPASCASSRRSSAARRARRSSRPRAGSRTPSSRASAAARTRSGSSPASSTTRTCGSSGSRPRARRAWRRAAPAVLHGARSSVLADDDGQVAGRALDLRRPRLPRRRAGARRAARLGPRRVRDRDRRGGARRVPSARRARGDPPGARAGARARPRARPRRASSSSSASRGAATRTSPRCSPPEKTLVVYLMAGPETPELARAAGRGRRGPDRDRLPVLRSARGRAGDPPRRRARARAGDAYGRVPRVPRETIRERWTCRSSR